MVKRPWYPKPPVTACVLALPGPMSNVIYMTEGQYVRTVWDPWDVIVGKGAYFSEGFLRAEGGRC